MHEFSICKNIVDTVNEHISKKDRVCRVTIKIGSLSGIEPESLLFCYNIMKEENNLKDSILEIKEIDTVLLCRDCSGKSKAKGLFISCSFCNSTSVDIIEGESIKLSSIEVYDND